MQYKDQLIIVLEILQLQKVLMVKVVQLKKVIQLNVQVKLLMFLLEKGMVLVQEFFIKQMLRTLIMFYVLHRRFFFMRSIPWVGITSRIKTAQPRPSSSQTKLRQ